MIISEQRIGNTIIYIDNTYVLTGEERKKALDDWDTFIQHAVVRAIIAKKKEGEKKEK